MERIDDALLNRHVGRDDLILKYYHRLNHDGRKEAVKRTRELTWIPDYIVEEPQEQANDKED